MAYGDSITAHHPTLIPAAPLTPFTVTAHGTTVYYSQLATVSATVNSGSITDGNQQTFTRPTYIIAATEGGTIDLLAAFNVVPFKIGDVQCFGGSGAPSNTVGNSGSYYFRSDTPTVSNQRVYVKNGASWTGIL